MGLAAKLGAVQVGLRRDLELVRQILRNEATYVFHDPISFKSHAFTVEEYQVLTTLSAARTLSACFAECCERGLLEEEDEEEFFQFVLGLHGLGMLNLPLNDAERMYQRNCVRKDMRRKELWNALMSLRVPIWDPDAFLERTKRWFTPFFSTPVLVLWMALWGVVLWSLAGRGSELFGDLGNILEPSNVPVLYIALVGLKALHEFGHAYCCKRFGGRVPEMGLALIVCTPCAYVDASASLTFPSRWKRIAVASAGMYVESWIAAIFALLWVGTPPGFVHEVARNVVVLASVTTVLFNLNPLMKFDGYYIFQDLLGTSNLRSRADQFIRAWCKRIALGFPRPAMESTRESVLLTGYGIGAVIYKGLIAFSLTQMVVLQWPLVGAAVGIFFAYQLIVTPLWRTALYLLRDDETAVVRTRARVVAAMLLGALPLLASQVPVSWSVRAVGALEPSSRRVLYAPEDGFLVAGRLEHGAPIKAGQELLVLRDDELALRLEELRIQLDTERSKLSGALGVDAPVVAQQRAAVADLEDRVRIMTKRLEKMHVLSPIDGLVFFEDRKTAAGRYFNRGDAIAEVLSEDSLLHVVLPVQEIDRLELIVGHEAEIFWSSRPRESVFARIVELRPVVTRDGVPEILTSTHGGEIYVTSGDAGDRADTLLMHVFLEPAEIPGAMVANLTARVRFSGEVRNVGQWLRQRVIELYQAWSLS